MAGARSRVAVDLAPARGEDVPLGTELVEPLPARLARLRVARVGVERVPGVGDLCPAVGALGGPELGGGHAAGGDALRARQRRPHARARPITGAGAALVLLEQVESAPVAVHEDGAELGPAGAHLRRGRRGGGPG